MAWQGLNVRGRLGQIRESRVGKAYMKIFKPLRLVLAGGCFLLGLVGLVMPIVPSVVFFITALVLLGTDNPPGRWIHNRLHSAHQHYCQAHKGKLSRRLCHMGEMYLRRGERPRQ